MSLARRALVLLLLADVSNAQVHEKSSAPTLPDERMLEPIAQAGDLTLRFGEIARFYPGGAGPEIEPVRSRSFRDYFVTFVGGMAEMRFARDRAPEPTDERLRAFVERDPSLQEMGRSQRWLWRGAREALEEALGRTADPSEVWRQHRPPNITEDMFRDRVKALQTEPVWGYGPRLACLDKEDVIDYLMCDSRDSLVTSYADEVLADEVIAARPHLAHLANQPRLERAFDDDLRQALLDARAKGRSRVLIRVAPAYAELVRLLEEAGMENIVVGEIESDSSH